MHRAATVGPADRALLTGCVCLTWSLPAGPRGWTFSAGPWVGCKDKPEAGSSSRELGKDGPCPASGAGSAATSVSRVLAGTGCRALGGRTGLSPGPSPGGPGRPSSPAQEQQGPLSQSLPPARPLLPGPTQLCESRALYAGPAPGPPPRVALEACVHTYTYIHIYIACCAGRPRGGTASYLNVLLGTHSMTHRAF